MLVLVLVLVVVVVPAITASTTTAATTTTTTTAERVKVVRRQRGKPARRRWLRCGDAPSALTQPSVPRLKPPRSCCCRGRGQRDAHGRAERAVGALRGLHSACVRAVL